MAFAHGDDTLDGIDLTILDHQNRLDVQSGSQQTLSSSDPSTRMEVLQRIDDKIHTDMVVGFHGDSLAFFQAGTFLRRAGSGEHLEPNAIDTRSVSITSMGAPGKFSLAERAECTVPEIPEEMGKTKTDLPASSNFLNTSLNVFTLTWLVTGRVEEVRIRV